MARKPPFSTLDAEAAEAVPHGDPGALMTQWFEGQLALFDTGVAQVAQSQQVLFQSWVQMVQACWAPWTPFLLRGGEQLA